VVAGRGTLPETVAGRPGFDVAAVSHLADVRNVLAGARLATWVLAAGLAVLATWALLRGRRDLVSACLRAGAVATAVLVALGGVAAVSEFDTFFSAFHGVFFAEGTWTFPYDSLLIRLFPVGFWSTSGVAWAGAVLAIALGYWVVGAWLVRGQRVLKG
jgi:integral membrane protein (TIGR01906 family)